MHEPGDGTQLVQVVPDSDEGYRQQQVLTPRCLVLAKDGEHLLAELGLCHHTAVRTLVKEVQETVRCVTVMSAVREQTELAVEEDDGVSRLEEILGGGGTTGSGGEVVDEADGLLF